MSRTKVALDLSRARLAARQPTLGIRNRPAMPTSSTAIKARCEARYGAAASARPVPAKASIKPSTVKGSCATVRRPRVPQAPRPSVPSRRGRQPSPETILIETLFPSSPAASESSMTTGRSFSFIAPPHKEPAIAPLAAPVVSVPSTPRSTSPLRPLMPQAPRAVKSRVIATIGAVPFPALLKSTKAMPLKGILKKAGEARSTAKREVRWKEERVAKGRDGKVLGEVEMLKVVDRWIGVPEVLEDPRAAFQQHASVLEAQTKAQHIHPDPTKYLGRLWGWCGPDGDTDYIFGQRDSWSAHVDCRSPDCNKRTLHQYTRRVESYVRTGDARRDLPAGEALHQFNARHNCVFSVSPEVSKCYPKDRGL